MMTELLFTYLSIALFTLPNILTKAEAQSDSSLGEIQFAYGQSFDRNTSDMYSRLSLGIARIKSRSLHLK